MSEVSDKSSGQRYEQNNSDILSERKLIKEHWFIRLKMRLNTHSGLSKCLILNRSIGLNS